MTFPSRCTWNSNSRRDGTTLVEVLVVIGIFGVLVGLLLPAAQQARGAASRAACQNNLRQVAIALQAFHSAHGRLPPRPVAPKASPGPDSVLGWMALVLPQMGEQPLYAAAESACRLDPNPLRNPPHTGLVAVVRSYTCPADGRLSSPHADNAGLTTAHTSYIGVNGGFVGQETKARAGVMGSEPGIRLTDVTDGTSQTLMVGERPPPANFQAGWWYPVFIGGSAARGPSNLLTAREPLLTPADPCLLTGRSLAPGQLDNPCDRYHFWSLHTGGANFAFADGSVRFLPYPADAILPALASRAGGEVVALD